MEWRIFLPIPNTEDAWLPDDQILIYKEHIMRMASVLESVDCEKRTDHYVVGQKHFGLKYRVDFICCNILNTFV